MGSLLLGLLFALAFSPTRGVIYFELLIPLSAMTTACYLLLPIVFALATSLPVLVVAWTLAFSIQHISSLYDRMQTIQRWMNRIIGLLFLAIGLYSASSHSVDAPTKQRHRKIRN